MAQTILPRLVSIVIVVIVTITGSLQFVLVHFSNTFSVRTPGVAVAAPAGGVVDAGGVVAVAPGGVVAAAPVVAVGFVPRVVATAVGVELEAIGGEPLVLVKSRTNKRPTSTNNTRMATPSARTNFPTDEGFPLLVGAGTTGGE